jgi:hypothetical protein
MKRTILVVVFLLAAALVVLAQAQTTGIGTFPPPNNGQTGFTYQASSNTYHFTRTDSSFSGVVVYDNSGTPGFPNTNGFSIDLFDAVCQLSMLTYHYNSNNGAYEKSSQLTLDGDYHFALGSSSGGGIGSDTSAGDTCIPVNILANGTCNVPSSLHINSQGAVSQYLGLPLDPGGNGASTIARAVNGSATGTVSNWPVWTTPASGYGASDFYELSWLGVVTSAAPGASAVATWNFTDESGPNSCSSANTAFGFAGNHLELTCRFHSVANTPINLSVTTHGGTPTYASHLRVKIN